MKNMNRKKLIVKLPGLPDVPVIEPESVEEVKVKGNGYVYCTLTLWPSIKKVSLICHETDYASCLKDASGRVEGGCPSVIVKVKIPEGWVVE